jgi:hypothetical protein
MNWRVLIKYDENLYSGLTLIRENQTFQFAIPERPVLLSEASLYYQNLLV